MKQISETGLQVLKRRYLIKNDAGVVIEEPSEMFLRVATAVAEAEKNYIKTGDADPFGKVQHWQREFYNIMSNLDFLPNSPTLMNAGRPLGQLSACFVLPIEDTMEDIFGTLRDAAMIHKSGGGTGFSFSRLRQAGARVSTTNGSASGPLSFMEAYNAATGTVVQGGTRRGANMGLLRVDHPDIRAFIQVKEDLIKLTNFNLSVGITEKFMDALKSNGTYDLIDPHTHKAIAVADAKEIWDMIIHSAWKCGEPGIIFLDRINETNFLKPLYGEIEGTNPCLAGNTPITILEDGKVVERCIDQLVGQWVAVWNGYEWSDVQPQVTGYIQNLLTILFSNGRWLRCTPYHKFIMCTAERKEARELVVGDVLAPWNLPDKDGGESVYVTDIIDNGLVAGEVYCLNEPKRHAFMANGIVVGNCGEQPLLPYEACNLGSINLANFVQGEHLPVSERSIDYYRLSQVVEVAVRFLDDVIDVNKYPLPQIKEMCLNTRKIGLGVMGFADMLHKLSIPYDSEKGFEIGRSVMQLIQMTAHNTSERLARERGVYPAYNELHKLLGPDADLTPYFRRNAMVTTIAPTGSISAIAGVSSGIEPLFANVFYKHVMDDDYLPVINQELMRCLQEEGILTPELEEKIKTSPTIAHMEEIPEHIRQVFVCAHDINPIAHVRMQSVFQEFVDNAISKTVNFNEDATEDDIRSVYELAYEFGCKGVTVYRNNCRANQVLNLGTVENKDTASDTEIDPATAKSVLDAMVNNIKLRNVVMDLYPTSQEFYSALDNIGGFANDVYNSQIMTPVQTVIEALTLIASNPNACKLAKDRVSDVLLRRAYHSIGDAIDGMRPGSHQNQKESIDTDSLHPDLVYRALCEFADKDASVHKFINNLLPREVLSGLIDRIHECSRCPNDVASHYQAVLETTAPRARPDSLSGYTRCIKINCGKLYVTVNHDEENQLFEVFTTNGKGGGCPAQSEAVCRLASLLLRSGVNVKDIIRQLRGIKCTACLKNPDIHVLSCPDAIARELDAESRNLADRNVMPASVVGEVPVTDPETQADLPEAHHIQFIQLFQGDEKVYDRHADGKNVCPQCGATMIHEGGCVNCVKCGYSNCG